MRHDQDPSALGVPGLHLERSSSRASSRALLQQPALPHAAHHTRHDHVGSGAAGRLPITQDFKNRFVVEMLILNHCSGVKSNILSKLFAFLPFLKGC
jgi:hypothetical protein